MPEEQQRFRRSASRGKPSRAGELLFRSFGFDLGSSLYEVWCSGFRNANSWTKNDKLWRTRNRHAYIHMYRLSIYIHVYKYVCVHGRVQLLVYMSFHTVCMNRIIIYFSGLSYILSHPSPYLFFSSPKQTLYLPLKTCSPCARSPLLPSVTLFSQCKDYSILSDMSLRVV